MIFLGDLGSDDSVSEAVKRNFARERSRTIYTCRPLLLITMTYHNENIERILLYMVLPTLLVAIWVSQVTCILATSRPSLHGTQRQQG